MATISKFYFHDASSPNTGTMPSDNPSQRGTFPTGDATGAATARDATDTIGTANPDTKSLIASTANQTTQDWGHRRFVSRPLAAYTFAAADGSWTLSIAAIQSNTNHKQTIRCFIYAWRPSNGSVVGAIADGVRLQTTVATTTVETAYSTTATWTNSVTISDGDILVFDVLTEFTQTHSSSYNDQFCYDGTTEASTTTCASFVAPPVALTLFTAAADMSIPDRLTLQAVNRAAVY